ncbi:MAG: cytochrome C biogenesis protein [Candidatus Taylorbacteria bacterium CG10_big_fil_rev_8_21_14_0_10_41_48]|uniref:Cytochrome C biogenesis protein n=1 Tax=Candidatus Taylorbacteria bacterium CG10_big_fil_rev_8_21_14_0_10_41_48 TaxID=1975024 RepID=A0A2M8LCR2_9BACT|nr:MAG: cytochrome C biogenesis protein [Candidatus Taylorbacteria bacterium CG10_big_fil_rev_8_21_14_0_10_41_48]
MIDITLPIAFLAGLVSFVAPCVLPILPGFLAYLAGATPENASSNKMGIFLNSLFFVLGFSVVFALLGVLLNTVLSTVAYSAQAWLSRVGGVIIIAFGLYLVGLLKISFLERQHTMKVDTKKHSRYVTSFLFGFAFAAGWTPCVGATLGAVLGLAATSPGSAFGLLLSYAFGLGLPFLGIGFFAAQASVFIDRYQKVFAIINKVFGLILIVLGVLVFTQELARVASFDLLNTFLLK